MKSKVFETVPFYNNFKIRDAVLELLNKDITEYKDDNHINILLSDLYKHKDEPIYINDTTIKINEFVYKDKFTSQIDNNNITRVIVCIKQAKKGGRVTFSNKKTNDKKTIRLNTSFIILLKSVAVYTISNVVKGRMVILTFDINIPSLRVVDIKLNNDIMYSNIYINIVPILTSEYVFVLKQLSYKLVGNVFCEQIYINRKWYTIITLNNKRYYMKSICFGTFIPQISFKRNDFNNSIITKIINNILPFDNIYPKKIIFDNMVVYEKILFGKINI
ncbi:protein A37 [BeAn 58058 virus]|uniref:protein A37 n=1 Tax=BeAn 58058 virus TaxID=67082 RepID=UPI00090AD30F|nr:protein A37 [BeAn 58058 virus]APG58348.1 protein A37 [BeAn 58058 virus]